jgi:formate dehydrogenase subunit beta
MSDVRTAPAYPADPRLLELAKACLIAGCVSRVLIPVRSPGGARVWSLVTDPSALDAADPLPPAMTMQGARALASFTQSMDDGTLLAVMRPCEARASVELARLEQIDMGHVVMLTMECPGSVPLDRHTSDREAAPDPLDPSTIRPLCAMCASFAGDGDICIGGTPDTAPACLTEAGRILLAGIGIEPAGGPPPMERFAALAGERAARAAEDRSFLRSEYGGLRGLTELFSGCIGCRICRTVCPICYCRLCFIDMKDRRSPAEELLLRSENAGAARLVPDTLLFHIGRMAHMSLSCVSCGMCEDACPSDIPVGRMMSMVSLGTTDLFGYRAGSDPGEPLPLNIFRKDELHEFED